MKFSLNWLKDYVDLKGVSTEELTQRLTMAGLEVESVTKAGEDTIFELEITPNRADALSAIGLSREIGTFLNRKCHFPKVSTRKFSSKKFPIEIIEPQACRRYVGTLIEGVSIKPATAHIKKCLESLGARCINNIVDATNFVLLETGQPLHAFDYDKIEGGKIIVRFARKGEKILGIDEKEYELDPSVLVIADVKRAIAIAGIMGGKATEVTTSTKNILLESAWFDPILIRRAARKLGIKTDSSYRFERGVDYEAVVNVSRRAIDLIMESTKGLITKYASVVAAKPKFNSATITISLDDVSHYIGQDIKSAHFKSILQKLGCTLKVQKNNIFKVTPPSFRPDLQSSVDLVEEITRMIGYDNIVTTVPHINATNPIACTRRDIRQKVRSFLIAQGFYDCITYSMTNAKALKASGQELQEGVVIKNPLSQDQERMRPSLLPSLLSIAQTNLNRGQNDLKLFETGKVYSPIQERETLAFLLTGLSSKDWRESKKRYVDFYDLKGTVEQMMGRFFSKEIIFESKPEKYFEDAQSAHIFLDKEKIGAIGKINAVILNQWGIKEKNILFAEIDLEALYAHYKNQKDFESIVEYPGVVRDLSLAVDEGVSFKQIKDTAFSLGGAILSSVDFNELYLGEKIPEGKRGLVVSLTYQDKRRTLTEDEVNQVNAAIIQALIEKFGIIQR